MTDPRRPGPTDPGFDLFDEDFALPAAFLGQVDLAALRRDRWLPLSLENGQAVALAASPDAPGLAEAIGAALGAGSVRLLPAPAAVILRAIDNTADVNPGFPDKASRTDLAKARTYLAGRRSLLAHYRTALAKARTGLSMFRTGLAGVTVALLLLRIFGLGPALPLELALLALGGYFIVDGLAWYWPARRFSGLPLARCVPPAGPDSGVITVQNELEGPHFVRSSAIPGAAALRTAWDMLSPVMRRRFLADDRTEFAGERTTLAELRSVMAKARTGLALGRTGIALAGIGIALLREYHGGPWSLFSYALVVVGGLMSLEGMSWYLPGRAAGRMSLAAFRRAEEAPAPWTMVAPPVFPAAHVRKRRRTGPPPVIPGQAPGVYGTTGLALERTLLAERRNVMARLRTHMSRARTGLSFIRTGLNCVGVGAGLLVSFGVGNLGWTLVDAALLAVGAALTIDGLLWYIPSERAKRRLPYCITDLDIPLADYTRPNCEWDRFCFELEDTDASR